MAMELVRHASTFSTLNTSLDNTIGLDRQITHCRVLSLLGGRSEGIWKVFPLFKVYFFFLHACLILPSSYGVGSNSVMFIELVT